MIERTLRTVALALAIPVLLVLAIISIGLLRGGRDIRAPVSTSPRTTPVLPPPTTTTISPAEVRRQLDQEEAEARARCLAGNSDPYNLNRYRFEPNGRGGGACVIDVPGTVPPPATPATPARPGG